MMNDDGGGLSEMDGDPGYFITPDDPLEHNENELPFFTDSEDQPGSNAGSLKEVTSTGESMAGLKIQSVRGNYSNINAKADKQKEGTKKRRGRKAKTNAVPVPDENFAVDKVVTEKSEGDNGGEKAQQVDKPAKGRLRKPKVTVPKIKPPHKCNKCMRAFSDKRDRNRHMLRIHEGKSIIFTVVKSFIRRIWSNYTIYAYNCSVIYF